MFMFNMLQSLSKIEIRLKLGPLVIYIELQKKKKQASLCFLLVS
jgi:hypothetical protein